MRHKLFTSFFSSAYTSAALVACCILSITACATYPTQELSDARQAVRAAEAIEANKHLPEIYNKAASLLTNAEEKLSTSPPHYSEARTAALAAKDNAIKARLLTVALLDANKTIKKLQSSDTPLTEAKQALEKAHYAIKIDSFDEAIKYAELAKNLALQGR